MIASNKNAHSIAKSCIFESSDMSLTSDINSASGIDSAEVSGEEAEFSAETDAETAINFEEKANLTEELARADNDVTSIIWFKFRSDIDKLLFSIEAFEFFAETANFWAKIVIEVEKLAESDEKAVLVLITWALNEFFLIEAFKFLAEIIEFWTKIVTETEELAELTENELFLFFLLFLAPFLPFIFFLFFFFFLSFSHRLFNLALSSMFNADDDEIINDDDDEINSEDDASDNDDEIAADDDNEILRA